MELGGCDGHAFFPNTSPKCMSPGRPWDDNQFIKVRKKKKQSFFWSDSNANSLWNSSQSKIIWKIEGKIEIRNSSVK